MHKNYTYLNFYFSLKIHIYLPLWNCMHINSQSFDGEPLVKWLDTCRFKKTKKQKQKQNLVIKHYL